MNVFRNTIKNIDLHRISYKIDTEPQYKNKKNL